MFVGCHISLVLVFLTGCLCLGFLLLLCVLRLVCWACLRVFVLFVRLCVVLVCDCLLVSLLVDGALVVYLGLMLLPLLTIVIGFVIVDFGCVAVAVCLWF